MHLWYYNLVNILADNIYKAIETIKLIQNTIKPYDENDDNMIVEGFDLEILIKKLVGR